MDVETTELYAVKIVPKQKKEARLDQITKEIVIHDGLDHENIVKFYNYFDDEHYIYIVLELCMHSSLMELQQKRIRITEFECRYYMLQLIRGVQYLHENGIIHRDLKLGNLFLNDKLQLKIGDFGLATCIQYEGESKKTICGTPNYVAPEILGGAGHSYNVDVWSIGCVMYTLLVGTPPFETATLKETYKKIKRADFQNPNFLSKQATQMIISMLLANPYERPTIGQLMDFEFMKYEKIPKQLPNILLTQPPTQLINIIQNTTNSTKSTTSDVVMTDYGHEVKVLYEQLLILINSKPILLTADLDDMHTDQAVRPLYWVSKWVDYSDKYGFGYQLCDDSIGVIFNDMTKIILLSNYKTIHFIDIDGKVSYMSTENYNSIFEKKVKLLLGFKRYMMEELQKAGAHIKSEEGFYLSRLPYVRYWFRSNSSIFMHLSNGVIQFNFMDHIKIILCSRMSTITRMDDKGNCHTYRFSTLMTHGFSQDLYDKLRKICGKLKMIF